RSAGIADGEAGQVGVVEEVVVCPRVRGRNIAVGVLKASRGRRVAGVERGVGEGEAIGFVARLDDVRPGVVLIVVRGSVGGLGEGSHVGRLRDARLVRRIRRAPLVERAGTL